MSFRAAVLAAGPNHYVLPRVGAMRVEVHAYLSEALFAATDETLWAQAAACAAHPGATGMYLMPDTHPGYHLPVGGVLVTDDVILQAGSGYDISCGVLYLRAEGLHAADVADWERRAQWVRAVEKRVAVGVGSGAAPQQRKASRKLVEHALQRGASR